MTEADISDLIELIELGFSNSEINQYFPALSIGSIAAYRAHLTRGTYSGGISYGANGVVEQTAIDN